MTDRQEDKRSMYLAVAGVCNANNGIWNGMPAFVNAFGEFETILSQIDTQRQIQQGNTTGITQNKQKEEDEMIQVTLEMAATVYAFASATGDHELKSKVDYSPTSLRNARDTVLKDICQSVHDAAAGVISSLADYGKTPEDLEHLQKEINDFSDLLGEPRTAIGTRATATARLEELFKDGDNLLKNQLDKLMVTYQTNEPVFYNTYQNARRIVSMGSRSRSEEEPELEV